MDIAEAIEVARSAEWESTFKLNDAKAELQRLLNDRPAYRFYIELIDHELTTNRH